MSENIIGDLSNILKISEDRAQKLLELANGDFERAKQLFIENMCAIKGHIISEDQKTYGVLLIVLNEMNNPEKVNMSKILFSKDKNLLSLSLETPYKKYYKDFFNLSFAIQLLNNLMNDVNNYLSQNISNLDMKKIYSEGNIQEVETMILKILKKIIKDYSIQMQLDYELISYAEYHIPEEKVQASKEGGADYETTETEKQQQIVTIKCDYRLSPAKGRAAKNLSVGDFIYIKINDTSPEALKIQNFLKEKYQGNVPDLRLPIINIEMNETERLAVYVQLTETVRGMLLINQEVKVKVYDPKESSLSNAESSGSFFSSSNYLAILIGLIILFVIIMLIIK